MWRMIYTAVSRGRALSQIGISYEIKSESIDRTMAGFHTKTFALHDDYMTPKSAWEAIVNYIPKTKVIWEAFYGNGQSGKYLSELGFTTIHEDIDFFENNKGDIIVSNPPFSKVKEVLTRVKELDKPFIFILPCSKINTQYVRTLFKDETEALQIIIPRKRIQFQKYENGKKVEKEEMIQFRPRSTAGKSTPKRTIPG
jgi:hypothetical protein